MQEEVTSVHLINGLLQAFGRRLGIYRSRKYELEFLGLIAKKLPTECQELFERQLKQYNHWFRMSHRQLVWMSNRSLIRRREIPASLRLPVETEGLLVPLAYIECKSRKSQTPKNLRVDVYVADGAIVQLTFHDRPGLLLSGKLDAEDIEVSKIEIVLDLTKQFQLPPIGSKSPDQFQGWVADWPSRWAISDARAALPRDLQHRLIDFYAGHLPADYIEAVRESEGFSIGNCKVYGLSTAFSCVTPSEDLWRLVEIAGFGNISVQYGRPTELFYIDNEGHIPVFVGRSFKDAVEHILTSGVEDWQKRQGEDIVPIFRFVRLRSGDWVGK